jgi:hypothetical protein
MGNLRSNNHWPPLRWAAELYSDPQSRHQVEKLEKLTVSTQILPSVGALANGAALVCTQWHQIHYIGAANSTDNAEKDFPE